MPQDFKVTGYVQGYCSNCPPDHTQTKGKVVNKQKRLYSDGRKEEVCLVCEFRKTQGLPLVTQSDAMVAQGA